MYYTRYIPKELKNYIYYLANNKCHICQIKCKIPYIKQSNFYYCSKVCYLHNH